MFHARKYATHRTTRQSRELYTDTVCPSMDDSTLYAPSLNGLNEETAPRHSRLYLLFVLFWTFSLLIDHARHSQSHQKTVYVCETERYTTHA